MNKPAVTQYVVHQTDTFGTWLAKLRDVQAKAAIVRRLERVAKGNLGDVKSVGDGVFEMRLTLGPGYRLYYTHRAQAIVLLLCGGDKSSQQQDVALAKQLSGAIK